MIISEEQVQLALRDLQNTAGGHAATTDGHVCEVPVELLERISERLSVLPDTRSERIEQARADLADGTLSADDVACKMLGRIISDSLR
jgi:transcription elongation GreA/GreB family factor